MAKYKSRAKRLSETITDMSSVIDDITSVHDNFNELIDEISVDDTNEELLDTETLSTFITLFNSGLDKLDISEIESLSEEMSSWHDNMEGTSLEYTGKFETVSEAANILEECANNLLIEPVVYVPGMKSDDILTEFRDKIEELENAISELETIEFPGMYR